MQTHPYNFDSQSPMEEAFADSCTHLLRVFPPNGNDGFCKEHVFQSKHIKTKLIV